MTTVEPPDGWSFRIVRDEDEESTRADAVPLLAQLLELYLADLRIRARPETIRHATTALDRLVRGMGLSQLADVTKDRLDEWRRGRIAAGASNRTANHEVSILAAALNHAMHLGRIAANPLAGLRALPTTPRHRRRQARALSDDEIRKLLDGARQVDAAARGKFPREPTLAALLATGARWNELVHTTWGDLDIDTRMLVLRAETTKSERTRSIPLAEREFAAIMKLRESHVAVSGENPTTTTRIFLTATGEPWPVGTRNFHRFLHEAMRLGGVVYKDAHGRVLHVHALRHTAATRWARQGMPLLELQRILGHSDPKLTQRVYIDAQLTTARPWISPLPRPGDGGTF